MKVLIACEESQTVCNEFRAIGHEAYSCDVQMCSGGHPEWHIMGDALKIINGDCEFATCDGTKHQIAGQWDLIIAHPPCTYLTNCATRHHDIHYAPLEKINARTEKRIEAMQLFMAFANANCKRIAIENPVGVMNTCYRQPEQIIHPYQFAESVEDRENYVTKRTCLWLKGLPTLPINDLPKPDNGALFGYRKSGVPYTWEERLDRTGGSAKARSKTFKGFARQMANIWGKEENLDEQLSVWAE